MKYNWATTKQTEYQRGLIKKYGYVPAFLSCLSRYIFFHSLMKFAIPLTSLIAQHAKEVLEKNRQLFKELKAEKAVSRIASYSSIGGMILSKKEQEERIRAWDSFWDASKKAKLKSEILTHGQAFGFKTTSFSLFYDTLDKHFEPVEVAEYAKVPAFFLNEFLAVRNGFYTVSTLVKIPFVKDIKTQKDVVVIDRKQTNETFLGTLKNDFEKLLNYSFIAIFLILLWAFRRIELVIITMIPIAVSWMLTTGMMGLFGLQFNIINIIVCTLIFGIGVDYSIFMTAALQKELTYGKRELPTYKTSILLSVTTTILGIGVLVFAKHPALKSIALIAIIGIFSALFITFVIQPLVFGFIVSNRVNKGKPPYEIKRFIHSSLSFLYYGLGGFVISILSVIGMKMLPFPKKRKLKAFHFVFSKFSQSVLMSYPSVRRKIVNNHDENFAKPAIIIANHTSFLDILAIAMLSPKIVFLVSDWVYNSPIFGKGVRLAGFYPVSNGIDNGVEHLREKVQQGFSLMVFPEGTRSEDNNIKRFHKGAFYLAEKLGLDIVPIVIHGYSQVLPKGDFIINGGKTTVEILKRISPEAADFGKDYAARTKKMSAYFKTHYRNMRLRLEGPDYFDKMLINSFAYKETAVISAVKKDLSMHGNSYYALNKLLSDTARIMHVADDYGQLDVLLVLREPQRKVVTFIANEEKRSVAKMNYIVQKRNIIYAESWIDALDNSDDVILISAGIGLNDTENKISEANMIILLRTPHLKDTIVNFGFAIESESEGLIVLKKHDERAL